MNPPDSSLLDSPPESYPGAQVTWRPGDPSSSFLLLSPSPPLSNPSCANLPALPRASWPPSCLRTFAWATVLPGQLSAWLLTWLTPVHLMALFKSALPLPPASTPGPADSMPLVYFLLSDVLYNLGVYWSSSISTPWPESELSTGLLAHRCLPNP